MTTHEKESERLKELNRRVLSEVAKLRAEAGEKKIKMEQEYKQRLEEERGKEQVRCQTLSVGSSIRIIHASWIYLQRKLEETLAAQLSELENRHAKALEEQAQEHQTAMEKHVTELTRQHNAAVESLEAAHARALQDAKTNGWDIGRAEAEAGFSKQVEQLKTAHQQAIQQMQDHHDRSLSHIEARLQQQQQAEQDANDTKKVDPTSNVAEIKKEVEVR